MIAFDIDVDGRHVCRASVGEAGSLDTLLILGSELPALCLVWGKNGVERTRFDFVTAGLGGGFGRLDVGSALTVRVVDTDDPPGAEAQSVRPLDTAGRVSSSFRTLALGMSDGDRRAVIENLIADVEAMGD